MVKPLGDAFDDRLEFNLTCVPPYVEAWVEHITHEWLHWVSVEACSMRIDDAVIDTILELADLQSSCWGGVIPRARV